MITTHNHILTYSVTELTSLCTGINKPLSDKEYLVMCLIRIC